MDIIYCAGANEELDRIALEEGFTLGVRSDRLSHYPVQFVDINYKRPNFYQHWLRVGAERPKYASIVDLPEGEMTDADVCRMGAQYLWLKDYCDFVIIIPKRPRQIALIPELPNIVIGYSVPTSYGGAAYPLKELTGRKVHLLGGSPAEQFRYYSYLTDKGYGQIVSVDGSAAKKGACFGDFWNGKRWQQNEYAGENHYYDSWRKSCRGIMRMWAVSHKED